MLSSIPLRVSDSVQKSKVTIRLLTVELDGRAFVELNFTSRLELSKFQRRLIPLSNTACLLICFSFGLPYLKSQNPDGLNNYFLRQQTSAIRHFSVFSYNYQSTPKQHHHKRKISQNCYPIGLKR